MAQRLVFRRRTGYHTPSNRVKIVKTPGGRLTYLHVKKPGTVPKCGDCGHQLNGLPALRPTEYKRLSKNQKTVNRAYGGSRCASCTRDRIVRAFLIEEQKIVKKVLKAKSKEQPAAPKTEEKKQSAKSEEKKQPAKTEEKVAKKKTSSK